MASKCPNEVVEIRSKSLDERQRPDRRAFKLRSQVPITNSGTETGLPIAHTGGADSNAQMTNEGEFDFLVAEEQFEDTTHVEGITGSNNEKFPDGMTYGREMSGLENQHLLEGMPFEGFVGLNDEGFSEDFAVGEQTRLE